MATQRVCDRCGEVINPKNSCSVVEIEKIDFSRSERYDLCVSCAFHLRKWLKKDGEST